jgi:hypothetical protein
MGFDNFPTVVPRPTASMTPAAGLGAVASSGNAVVQHNYHDYAQLADEMLAWHGNTKASLSAPQISFPSKLHQMLEEVKQRGGEHIVGWRPHGRAFSVQNQALFASKILPW